ncbi:MAG: D-alanyl-D-alanine carboxypeptidase [Lachnospiraceae bacterium]|nr:D-alanyl-D-alanine carboxypeptidase [Lachnospiraceae bacterium]
MSEEFHKEEETRQRHRQRIEQMQRSKRRQMVFRRCITRYIPAAAGLFILSALVFGTIKNFHNTEEGALKRQESGEDTKEEEIIWREDTPGSPEGSKADLQQNPEAEGMGGEAGLESGTKASEGETSQGDGLRKDGEGKYTASKTSQTRQVGDEILSEYAIFIDRDSQEVLAEKGGFTVINPASMTKILTVLVAAEHIKEEDLDDTIIMTPEITDYGYIHKCSAAGFVKGEEVSVRDLFYGTILPSGADAAVGLAVYVAGDQDSFVELMNEKLKELGLSDTAHFTNCVGVYDEDHYCSAYDMAMILEAALDNELCREILSTRIHTIPEKEEHPDGLEMSNWFLRRIEDKEYGGKVLGGKTGYVEQSGSCAASFGENAGNNYICVTVKAGSPFQCVNDHALLYNEYGT